MTATTRQVLSHDSAIIRQVDSHDNLPKLLIKIVKLRLWKMSGDNVFKVTGVLVYLHLILTVIPKERWFQLQVIPYEINQQYP